MSYNDSITVQSADPVPMASDKMSMAEIDDIARRAAAVEVTCKMDASAQSDSKNETKVAGEIGMEVAGGGLLKLASVACEVIGDRVDAGETHLSNPVSGKTDGIVSGKADTMDKMIRRSFSGEQIVMGANIAQSSLCDQGSNVGTWAVKSGKMGGGFDLAKRCTFDKELAHRSAMDSVYSARIGHDAIMHRASQMMPGGMMMSATLKPSDSLAMAERARAGDVDKTMDRWRSGGSDWNGTGDTTA